MDRKPTIGFIGQGWIGKNYADDFEERGFSVVRYSLEPEYVNNKEHLSSCEIIFVAVPTPTTTAGFDLSLVEGVLPLTPSDSIVVIKSTLIPGSTERLQEMFPDRTIVCSPEFLREKHAAEDARHPERTIIGVPTLNDVYQAAATRVLSVLPESPYRAIMPARAAELVKYAGNVFLAIKVVYANLLFDMAGALSVDYEAAREAIAADSRIGPSHLQPVHASGHSAVLGRGAGGHCFIKDMEAFRQLYDSVCTDVEGANLLDAVIQKNNKLLRESGRDIDLLESVYGTL